MATDIDYEPLFDGVQIDDDLIVKATLRVEARPMKHPVVQSLSEDLTEKYKSRMEAMQADIQMVLDEDDGDDAFAKSELWFTADGRIILKATNPSTSAKPSGPQTPKFPKPQQAPKTEAVTAASKKPAERKLTPSGYIHVEDPGSRGGKFYRDDKGNVRYGEKPHGDFQIPASPEHIVEHYRKYAMPQANPLEAQEDINAAMRESEVLSETDHAFMDWWNENYDEVLKHLSGGTLNRKKVEKAGGLQNCSFTLNDGRNVGAPEAIEEFFKANTDAFCGDPQFGDLESSEDILEAVRGLMDRYRKALHEDPKVQALATQHAEKREAMRSAFYVQCEQMDKEFQPLANDMFQVSDPNDCAARFTVAMAQLGLIERGGKSKVSQKRMRGAIVPKSSLLLTDKRNLGSLWQDNQLERLNASQLMSVYIASELQSTFGLDNMYHYAESEDELSGSVFDLITKKLGADDDASKKLLKQKLVETTAATAKAFNDYNSAQDPHYAELFKLKTKDVAGKGGDVFKDHMKKTADEQARIEDILAAQDDDSFVPPPSMKNGIWNGKTLKDPNDPSKGVWEPFAYQAKYINWMMKAKRGVIAADAGMGKGQPYDEPVLTPFGFRPIGSVKIGDSVIGKNGLPTKVIGKFPQGIRECYRIHFSDSTFVNCDVNHVWTLKVGSGERASWHDKTTKQILDEGWEHENGRKKFGVPIVEPVQFGTSAGKQLLDPYVLGLLLGDGSLREDCVAFHKPEADLLAEMLKEDGSYLCEPSTRCAHVKFRHDDGYKMYDVLKKYELLGTKAATKFVPKAYKFGSIETRLSILQGLLDTDGSVLMHTVLDYSTISKQLAKDVAFIARSLGAQVRMSSRRTTYSYKGEQIAGAKSWRLQMRFTNGLVPIRSKKNLAKYQPNDVNPKDKRIVDIERIEDQETVCIKVAAADGLFVTRGFTVTHNTPTVIAFREQLAAQGKDVPAICFLPPSLMEQWPAAIQKFAPENADKVLNLSGLSLEERKVALQSDMAKKARYIFISTGTLTGDVPNPEATDAEDDGTGGSDHEMVNILKGLEGAVFIDEAHQGGYKKAGNTRHEIAKAVMQDREYAFGMTATPMPNDPMDVYHLANLFAPGSVGDEELWAGRMAGVKYNEEEGRYVVTNPEHLADLNKRLKPFVFYKSLSDPDVIKDMGKGLPDKQGVHNLKEMWPDEGDLELSTKVNSENGLSQHDYFKEGGFIDSMVNLRMKRLQDERTEKVKSREVNPDTGEQYQPYDDKMLALMAGGMKITLQRQASISPALIDPSYRKQDGGVAHTPKMNALCDDIVSHFSNGGQGGSDAKPLVVFCSYPGKAFPLVRKALADRGVDPSLIETIAGDVAPSERGYMQDKLNKGHAKVLLVGTMSGGAGLNLQEAANKTLFLDEPWNPAAKRQAIGRVWRTGQKNTVFEKTYRSVGTYDAAVEQKLAGKQAMVAALLGKTLPTAENFNAEGSIKELLGRAKGASQFDEHQLKAILENSKKYDLHSPEQKQAESFASKQQRLMGDEDWADTAAAGGRGGAGANLTDKDFEPNKEAQKELKKKGAHSLTKQFDEKEFRGQWEKDRDQRRSKQNYEMANLMADVYRKKGDKAKAEQYETKAKELSEKYPELKPAVKGKAGKQPAKAKQGEQKPKAAKPVQLTATVGDAEKKLKETKKEKPKQGEKKPKKEKK